MLLNALLSGLCLATAIEAVPTVHEVIRVKRGADLSARDLELADMHQVNLTESKFTGVQYRVLLYTMEINLWPCNLVYKHSVVKRSDGDDVTIWVHNSYEEAELESPEENPKSKRQTAKLHGGAGAANWRNFPDYKNCRPTQYNDITSSTSPYTGGIHAIRDWTRDNVGYFLLGKHPETGEVWGPDGGWGWRTVLVGGSNSGRNARFRFHAFDPNFQYFGIVGNPDVEDACNWTLDHRREYNGRWRAAAAGFQYCGPPGSRGTGVEWQIISWDQRV